MSTIVFLTFKAFGLLSGSTKIIAYSLFALCQILTMREAILYGWNRSKLFQNTILKSWNLHKNNIFLWGLLKSLKNLKVPEKIYTFGKQLYFE